MKKYELTDETIEVDGHTLYRIKALRSFGNVQMGDLGGFIETERNLSDEGSCWVYYTALVYGESRVSENAHISGGAQLYEDVDIYGDVRIGGNVHVYGGDWIGGHAKILGLGAVPTDLDEKISIDKTTDIKDDLVVHTDFEVGNVVTLKSGGYEMTIISTDGNKCTCMYCDSMFRTIELPRECLILKK